PNHEKSNRISRCCDLRVWTGTPSHEKSVRVEYNTISGDPCGVNFGARFYKRPALILPCHQAEIGGGCNRRTGFCANVSADWDPVRIKNHPRRCYSDPVNI